MPTKIRMTKALLKKPVKSKKAKAAAAKPKAKPASRGK